MKIENLRVFVATARQRGVSNAAKALGIDQPTASRHLKSFAAQFAGPLFHRTGRGIELTGIGHAVFADVAPVLDRLDEVERKYGKRAGKTHKATFIVGGSRGPSMRLLPPIVDAFGELHPELEVALRTGTSTDIEEKVVGGLMDVAVVSRPSNSPAIVRRAFRTEELLLVVAAKHPLARSKKLKVSDVPALPLIVATDGNGISKSLEVLAAQLPPGLSPSVKTKVEAPASIRTLVQQGRGAGLLFREMVDRDLRCGRLKSLPIDGIDLRGENQIIYAANRALSAAGQSFLEFLQRWPDKPGGTKTSRSAGR
jgi:DNA-binding transcriptional LysR family regulator